MWKRNATRENIDSDQSISEEEDLGIDLAENAISLCSPADNKREMQMLSKLEILRDFYELHQADTRCISPHETKASFYSEDDVEDPLFKDEDNSSHRPRITSVLNFGNGMICIPTMPSAPESDEEIVSDDEKVVPLMVENLKENSANLTEALACLHENSGSSSSHGLPLRGNKPHKECPPLNSAAGARTKAKPKFAFHFQSLNEDLASLASDRNEDGSMQVESVTTAPTGKAEIIAEPHLYFNKKPLQLKSHMAPRGLAQGRDFIEHSMAEDVNKRERRPKMVSERNVLPLAHVDLDDNDDLPEALDASPPILSDNELLQENPQSFKTNIMRPMADHFHEAYGTVPEADERSHFALPGPLCGGLFGKLQQVMQTEKEKDMAYLKSSSAEAGARDTAVCISVRILSKSLEAKLTVCNCSVVHGEKSYLENNPERGSPRRILTIIFNPRICSDVELEVGSLIHIHSPWKEVQGPGRDEVIILCSYFSQS